MMMFNQDSGHFLQELMKIWLQLLWHTVERTVWRGLNELELSAAPESAYSVKVHVPVEKTEKPARTKKAPQPQRE